MMNSDGGDEDAYSIKRDDIMRIEDAIVVVVVVEDSDAAVIDAMTMLQHWDETQDRIDDNNITEWEFLGLTVNSSNCKR